MEKTCTCGTGGISAPPDKLRMNYVERKGGIRRFREYIRMAVPAFIFLIIPKCPLCLAAWIAVGTGLGIPLTAAAWIRWALIGISGTAFFYLLFLKMFRLLRNRNKSISGLKI